MVRDVTTGRVEHTKEGGVMREDVTTAGVGDIVRFKSYALRVSQVETIGNGAVRLTGRKSTDGCPIVRKTYRRGFTWAVIERAEDN